MYVVFIHSNVNDKHSNFKAPKTSQGQVDHSRVTSVNGQFTVGWGLVCGTAASSIRLRSNL